MLIFGYSRLFATDYYVITTGNDSNNGSAGSPWRTISQACVSGPANAGHRINIGAGLFTEINYLIVPAGVSIILCVLIPDDLPYINIKYT